MSTDFPVQSIEQADPYIASGNANRLQVDFGLDGIVDIYPGPDVEDLDIPKILREIAEFYETALTKVREQDGNLW